MSNGRRVCPRIVLANLLWFATCIPGWLAFMWSARNVKRTQIKIFFRILRRNAQTQMGRRHNFDLIRSLKDIGSVPLSEYEDYLPLLERLKRGEGNGMTHDPVEALIPTSGSVHGTKLIPYTKALRREYRAAVNPWVASLYWNHPSLLMGRHYWSVSPTTPCSYDPSIQLPVGFNNDSEYLGIIQRIMSRTLFAVPEEVSGIADQKAFEYVTLLFLIREKNLRIISVWHPSFLTVLVKNIRQFLPDIIQDLENGTINEELSIPADVRHVLSMRLHACLSRARELKQIDVSDIRFPSCIWPSLHVISCWTDGCSEPWVSEIARWFPDAIIQGKGLIATEGIVSFPLGPKEDKVCAVRSHFFEFIVPGSGEIRHAWDVEEGRTYAVVLTTGAGLYRYKLHDLVRVTGFFNQLPCLKFLSRDNLISDIVGEKLNAQHVGDCLAVLQNRMVMTFSFAMLAPTNHSQEPQYVLYIQADDSIRVDYQTMASVVERLLEDNYHYRHARRISQLKPLRIFRVEGDASAVYRNALLGKGVRAGDIKFMALSPDADWARAFQGEFVV